jgi:hypothetical protein
VSLAASTAGISWTAPSVWHPDELVYRVNYTIVTGDDGFFDRTNFDYPSLPKHVLYGVGSLVYAAGGTAPAFVVVARLVSAGLGAAIVILTYLIAGQAGATWRGAAVAALLTALCSLLVINTHFAHNDAYLAAFTTLAAYCALRYQNDGHPRWLWGSFAAVGLATSSKYNGASVLIGLAVDTVRADIADRRLRLALRALCIAVIAYSGARSVSVALLFLNDARISLAQTLATLPGDTVIAYGGRFGQGGVGGGRTFFKLGLNIAPTRQIGPFPDNWRVTYLPGQQPALRRPDEIASGDAIEQSCATHYVIDSFTWESFEFPGRCSAHADECRFLERLDAGQSSFKPVRTLSYNLPEYLPQLVAPLVNPSVRLFERQLAPEQANDCGRRRWQPPWRLELHAGATARLKFAPDGSEQLRVDLDRQEAALPWHVTLTKASSMISGRQYGVEFHARADAPRTLVVAVGRNEPPWDALGLYQHVSLGTSWAAVHLAFTATDTTSNARLYFPAAGHSPALELADVRLVDVAEVRNLAFNVRDR